MSDEVYLRDLDGTGSMHVCSKGDAGFIPYLPNDLLPTLAAALELPEVKALVEALERIYELNYENADENGHRWHNSDLIAQEVSFAIAQIKEPK
jgi:hypothetical protein